jgi:hypothetical protein
MQPCTEKSCGWKLIETGNKDPQLSIMGNAAFMLFTGTIETSGSDTRQTFFKICYKRNYRTCKSMLYTLPS